MPTNFFGTKETKMPPKRKAAEKSAETSEKETTKKTKASSSEVTAEAPAKKVAAGKLAVGSKLPSGLEASANQSSLLPV